MEAQSVVQSLCSVTTYVGATIPCLFSPTTLLSCLAGDQCGTDGIFRQCESRFQHRDVFPRGGVAARLWPQATAYAHSNMHMNMRMHMHMHAHNMHMRMHMHMHRPLLLKTCPLKKHHFVTPRRVSPSFQVTRVQAILATNMKDTAQASQLLSGTGATYVQITVLSAPVFHVTNVHITQHITHNNANVPLI
eukprot:5152685-Prymnesium_polylepis.1